METYNHGFKDKDGTPISDQAGIAYAKRKMGDQAYKYFTLYCPEYGVCAADTRRWTSAFHGLPAASDIKSCFAPIQGENGIFLHADFSQNEYKVFAALAKEDGIVQAFREGKDIHRFIASKTFQKPESEITGAERNVAKRLSFGLLYGKSVPAIADEYFRGDIKYAQKLFDDFFTMFPRVKAYIEEQKEMLFSRGYITTVFGDPIHITYDPNKKSSINDAIRYSGNYPTQSSASSAAALVGEKIDKLARDRAWDMYLAGFIHDCEEGSFATPLLLDVFTEYPKLAETFPYETYGLPMSIDIEIGVCGGPGLVEFKREKGKLVFVEDGVLSAKFEGETSYVNRLFERIGQNFTVEFDDVEEEPVYQSWSEMYLRVASSYRTSLGKNTLMKSGKVRIHR